MHQLADEHEEFFKEYLQKCISLHSKLQVSGLIENINAFLCKNYELTHISFTPENRQRLEEKLKYIEIPLDYLDRYLVDNSSLFSTDVNLNKSVNYSINTFLTSTEPQLSKNDKSSSITKALQSKRWIIILGDPGNAKTTLLRSIMCVYAKAVHHRHEKVILNEHNETASRIPILIRIGEFASWLEQHQTKTLIDYIGEHTWFSERYCHNDSGNVLKKLIYHGHTLILLDGLDEIPEVRRRGEIVKLIREFIDKYVNAPDFVSAFDDKLFDGIQSSSEGVAETQSPSKSGGNQIIITSRIVGYDMNSLIGPFITHYLLLFMNHDEVNKFANNWMLQVENVLYEILSKEEISIDKEKSETLLKRRIYAVESIFQKQKELLFLNSSLLTLICKIIFQSPNEFQPKSRVEVYNYTVESALRSWINHEPSISKDLFRNFLINLSTYLHLESSSVIVQNFVNMPKN